MPPPESVRISVRRVLLFGMRQDQHGVDVHDHLAVRVRRCVASQLPDVLTDFGPCPADRCEHAEPGRGESVDQAGDGRIGGYRPEHGGLGTRHRDIGQAVPAQGDPQCEVQQDLAGIMDCPLLAPRSQSRRHRRVEPRPAGGLDQQHGAGLRDHRATIALDADTRVQPATLLHEECSLLDDDRPQTSPTVPSQRHSSFT